MFCILSSIWIQKIFSMHINFFNFSGIHFCSHKILVNYPTNISQLQQLINTNKNIRASGFGHSWNPYTCPNETGVVVKMQEMRKLSFENNEFIVGAGASMGSLVNFMMKYDQELPSFWVSDISIGGAIATGIHNDGIGFFECCVNNLKIIDGLGNIVQIGKNDSMWNFIPGSIGRLGIIVEVTIVGQPLSRLLYTTTKRKWTTHKDVLNAMNNFSKTTTLWITHSKIIKQEKEIVGFQFAPNATYSRFSIQTDFVHRPMLRSFFASILSSLLTIFPLISYSVLQHNYDEFEKFAESDDKDTIHYTTSAKYIENDKPSRMKTLKTSVIFSTIDIDLIVHKDNLELCLKKLLHPPVFFPLMHARHAQESMQKLVAYGQHVHIDFSLPTWTLSRFPTWFTELHKDCDINFSHPGKASTELMTKFRDYTKLPLVQLPKQHKNYEFEHLITTMDPHGKFAPQAY